MLISGCLSGCHCGHWFNFTSHLFFPCVKFVIIKQVRLQVCLVEWRKHKGNQGNLVSKVRVCNKGLIFISLDLCILKKLELSKEKIIMVHFNYHYYFIPLLALLMVSCSITYYTSNQTFYKNIANDLISMWSFIVDVPHHQAWDWSDDFCVNMWSWKCFLHKTWNVNMYAWERK